MRNAQTTRRNGQQLFLCAGIFALTLVLAVPAARADDETPAVDELGTPTSIALEPAAVTLNGKRAQQRLIVTGSYGSEHVRDLTHLVQYGSSDSGIVRIEEGIARPVANGTAQIVAAVGGLAAVVPVTVTDIDQPAPVSFHNDTLAALTKAGCNMGACHGSPSGKGGFRLSLRGFDPPLDEMTLRSEFFGRRVDLMKPDESLILRNPLMEVAHGGGRRMKQEDAVHTVLRDWIAEGMQVTPPAAELLRIEVHPHERIFHQPASRQQLMVLGHFSDGSTRDLTALTVFSSSSEPVATVSEAGLVEKAGRGETAILARYLDKMDTAYITFLEDVPGFAWSDPSQNNFIDALVYDKLKQLQILPSDLCTDDEFLRRAYLDVTGRLPTIEETQAFLADASPDKRNRLIDTLLDSPDYAEFWTLKWGDVLRSNSKKLKTAGVHKFRRWIYDGILHDKPFDQFARELLTASGSAYDNPAANYWRASPDAQDATETTAQLFLGIRIQCAKCHNHPFERWSQDNYYGIAAAFTRVARKPGADDADEEVIYVKDSGEVQQPRTGQTMKVHLLLKGDVDVPPDTDRREVFADWLTSPENPFFARATVNRIWGHLMGRGIVDPVDDFRDSNPPSNAALLDELARQFAANGFSQKWAIRTIMQSRTYQLSSRKNPFNENDETYFSHATTRLLTAEQLLDAISHVTRVDETFAGLPPGTRAVELPDPPTDHYFLKVFGQPQREMACQCERSSESNLSQALQMINGPTVHNKLRADGGRIARMIAEGKSDEEIITTIYLAAVCRNPVEEEMAAAKQHIANNSDRRLALEDVGWAVLNSKEFLFQH